MPVVRAYPLPEVEARPAPNAYPDVGAAGDVSLFGGEQARDLLVAGQNIDRTGDNLGNIADRMFREANDSRVQAFNNQYIDGAREILHGAPDAYYRQKGADAIQRADGTARKLATLRDRILGRAVNDYQRQKLAPILDAHLAASADGIVRHAGAQQDVYDRTVAIAAIESSRAEGIADPASMANAVVRAEGAARALNRGQAPEVVENEARRAGAFVIAGAIGDRLARNDPLGVALLRRLGDRLDPGDRRTLGAAAATLSNMVEATAWVRDRSAGLAAPEPAGEPAPDAVASPGGNLLDQEGVAGHRQRMTGIAQRRRALTALNAREFAGNAARQRANRTAIEADSAQGRAVVKAAADKAYADLQAHMTKGGPGGGAAITLPPATLLSQFTDAQQDAVADQVNRNIEGRKTSTDRQTWYAIHHGLTGDDAIERERWASANLVQFMDRLSEEDYAALVKRQTAVRNNDGGAEPTRLQTITRMANRALRLAGIDPTPRPGASPDSDAAQAATFHRALQDDLSALGSRGRKATIAEARDIVDGLMKTVIEGG